MSLLSSLFHATFALSFLFSTPLLARDWNAIKTSGTLLAATEGASPPFTYHEGNNLTGYEVEVAEALAKKLNLKISWSEIPFDTLISAVSKNRFDFAISSHSYTEARAQLVDFASPHYCTSAQIVAPKNGALTVAALKNKSVGALQGSSYATLANKIPETKAVKLYKTKDASLLALSADASDPADAVISNQFSIEMFLKKSPNADLTVGETLLIERISLIMPKGNKEVMDKINQALADLTKDGTLKRLSEKYLKRDITCR